MKHRYAGDTIATRIGGTVRNRENDVAFIEAMEEILCPSGELEIGHDEFVYGSYVVWPPLESCDDDQLALLLDYFGIEIPFGETQSIQALAADAFGVNLDIVREADPDSGEVTFCTLDEAKPRILNFLREQGVPEGTVSEYDMDDSYPDHLRYFTSKHLWDDPEMDYYTQTPITLTEYLQHIDDVKIVFGKTDDKLTKCSLILSALIFAECYVKSTITNQLNSVLPYISKVFDRDTFMRRANQQMRREDGQGLFHRLLFAGRKLPQTPCWDIRNSLAHSIDTAECKLENGTEILTYLDSSSTRVSINVEEIFSKLSDFRLPNHQESEPLPPDAEF